MKRAILYICALALSCAIYAQVKISGSAKLSGNITLSAPSAAAPTLANCTAFSILCTAVNMSADPYNTLNNIAGYADPTEYLDANTGTLWLAQSFLTVVRGTYQVAPCASVTGSWAVIETHLLKSTDSGANWINTGLTTTPTPPSGVSLGNLFPAQPVCNLQSGQTDMMNSEVVSLVAKTTGGVTNWAALRLTYATHPGGGGVGQQGYSARMALVMANGNATTGPMALQSATPMYVYGSQANSVYWPATNLQLLSPTQLSACSSFREPALIWDTGTATTLDVFLGCGTLAFNAEFQIANAQATNPAWTWTYVNNSNQFAVGADANSLCAYVHACSLVPLRITELNLSPNAANTATEACFSIVDLPGGSRHSDGAVCTHLATLTPPTFAVDGGSNIIVDATLLSSDSVNGGPGSPAYAPGSTATGAILAHKLTNCAAGAALCSAQGGFFSTPMKSTLLP